MMPRYRAAIGISGGCRSTTFPRTTPHSAVMDGVFSVIDPIHPRRTPSGPVERVPGPFQEHWR